MRDPHTLITEDSIYLKGVPLPNLKVKALNDATTTLITEMHCYNICATSMSLKCCYFETEEQCKFCTINIPIENSVLPERFTDEQIIESLKLRLQFEKIRGITVTTGTYVEDRDKVAKQVIELLKKINKVTEIRPHVFLEPVNDLLLLKEMAKYADSIGLFLEFFDEKIRKEICPGKAKVSQEQYIKNWREAVKYVGRGKVSTHWMLGFGEDFASGIKHVEDCAKIGVKVTLLFVRVGSNSLGQNFIPSYIGKEKELVNLHIKVAEIMLKYGLHYTIGGSSGCLGCGGCAAMMDAFRYVQLAS